MQTKCVGCGKDITNCWNFNNYGWCCVQHWKEKETLFSKFCRLIGVRK